MRTLLTLALLAVSMTALAQSTSPPANAAAEKPSRSRNASPNPADLEPAVDVGGPRVALATPPVAPAAPVAPKAAPPLAPKAVTPAAPATAAAAQGANRRVVDRLDLGTTSITGNAELPKVLYIVPWKKSDLGDLVGRPVNTLLDEVLAPVDPAVFQRHLSYYDSLYGEPKKEE
ncbi:MAG: hypothetical protein ABI640_11890 [Gammaproteobacteria bacterium]